MAGTFIKDPSAKLDYGVDWSLWLGADTLVTSDWRVATPTTAPAGAHLTMAAGPAPSIEGKTARVWVEGGVVGVVYELTNTITTTAGRTDERTLRIACRQK